MPSSARVKAAGSSQVRHVEEVENLSDQVELDSLGEAERLRDAQVLRDDRVATDRLFRPAAEPASQVGSQKFGSLLSQRPVGLSAPQSTPRVGMLLLYAVMRAFNSLTLLMSRPIEPVRVPGR